MHLGPGDRDPEKSYGRSRGDIAELASNEKVIILYKSLLKPAVTGFKDLMEACNWLANASPY